MGTTEDEVFFPKAEFRNGLVVPTEADCEIIPVKVPLKPFQVEGVRFFDSRDGRALNADEPGAMKTAQALGYLSLRRRTKLPALVACPSGLKINWYREILRFTDLRPVIIVSKSQRRSFEKAGFKVSEGPTTDADVLIVNYELFRADYDKKRRKLVAAYVNGVHVREFKFLRQLVYDEMHRIKDSGAQVTKVALALSYETPTIGLTGTPIVNRPKDYWTQIRAINRSIFPKFFDYGMRYCGGKQKMMIGGRKAFGWDFSGASNLDELNERLSSTIMIRRRKKDVLPELPEQTIVTVPLLVGGKNYQAQRKASAKTLLSFREKREQWKLLVGKLTGKERAKAVAAHAAQAAELEMLRAQALDEVDALKLAAALEKLKDCVDFIVDKHETNGKVLVFATHHDVVDALVAALAKKGLKVGSIDGRVTGMARQKVVDGFQEGDLDVIVCTIKTASVGFTLTASSTVVFVEFGWHPADHDQAQSRVDRYGQKNASTAYYLVSVGTIEEKVVQMIDAKREVVNASLGEGDRTIDEDGIIDAVTDMVLSA